MKLKQKNNDQTRITGHYRFVECDPFRALEEYHALLDFLHQNPLTGTTSESERSTHREQYLQLSKQYHDKATVRVREFDNLVPTVGRNVFARRLAGDLTYTGTVNYAALGSDATAPTNGDTTLGTEVYRKVLDSATVANNVAYLSTFFAAGVATAIHYEAGLFIDGGAGADTGRLFSHVVLSPPVDKGALTSLTLDATITIN